MAFVRARLDDDERVAKAAGDYNFGDGTAALTTSTYVAAHIALHDPARALREVEAKRRLLDYLLGLGIQALNGNWWSLDIELPFRLLALPFDHHPDYQEGWRP